MVPVEGGSKGIVEGTAGSHHPLDIGNDGRVGISASSVVYSGAFSLIDRGL